MKCIIEIISYYLRKPKRILHKFSVHAYEQCMTKIFLQAIIIYRLTHVVTQMPQSLSHEATFVYLRDAP